MKEAEADLKEDVSKVRSLRGFLDNDKRLSHSLDSDEVKSVPNRIVLMFLRALHFFNCFLNHFNPEPINIIGNWLSRYSHPYSSILIFFLFGQRPKRRRGDPAPPRTTIQSLTFLKKSHEHPLRTFVDVPYILQKNWTETVKEALASVLTTNWNFGGNIEQDELDGFIDVGDFLFNHDL